MSQLNQVLLHESNRIGVDFEKWQGVGGCEALKRALDSPSAVLDLIRESGIKGLGGSGFPTHVKWNFIINQSECRGRQVSDL